MSRTIAIAMLVVSFVGCSLTTVYVPLRAAPRAPVPRAAESVELFTTPRIERPYIEVGVLSTGGGTIDVMLQELRVEAAKRGCDAVYVWPNDSAGMGTCLIYTEQAGTSR